MSTEDKQVAITLVIMVLLVFILSEIKSCHQEKSPDITPEECVIPYDE